MPRYHGIALLDAITSELRRRGIRVVNIGNDFLPRSWDAQRRALGSALIYLNATFDSPMPRGRTEAMLSGCCVITTPFHDADRFIETGVDGFVLDDGPLAWSDLIEHLLTEAFDDAVQIGQRARKRAMREFHNERYLAELWQIVTSQAARAPTR
jgi:glycosyltransferase involved in cell wall biosynthesis